MSLTDEDDGNPRRDLSELLPVVIAVFLTLAALGVCFLSIDVHHPKPPPPAPQPSEVMIGIGKGQTIHPLPMEGTVSDPAPRP